MLNFKILNYLLKQWRIVQKQMRKGVQCLTQSQYNVGVVILFISAIINITNLLKVSLISLIV